METTLKASLPLEYVLGSEHKLLGNLYIKRHSSLNPGNIVIASLYAREAALMSVLTLVRKVICEREKNTLNYLEQRLNLTLFLDSLQGLTEV